MAKAVTSFQPSRTCFSVNKYKTEWREGHKLCGGVQRHIARSGVTGPKLIDLTVLPIRVLLYVTKKWPNVVTLAIKHDVSLCLCGNRAGNLANSTLIINFYLNISSSEKESSAKFDKQQWRQYPD